MKHRSKVFLAALMFLYAFTLPPEKPINVFMAGDSTMAIKDKRAFPEMGWGVPFAQFFDSSVTVINRAKNGRSTRTFITEGLWKSITDELKEGDVVIIEFGHNDEVQTKKSATKPDEFKTNLSLFVKETRDKKALPILMTPVGRRLFKDGKIQDTHTEYAALLREVATDMNVPLVDMDTKTRELYQRMGEEGSKNLFLQLKPGEHPNYPDGKDDNTHFNELGARLVAQIALAEIRSMDHPLAARIFKPAPKK